MLCADRKPVPNQAAVFPRRLLPLHTLNSAAVFHRRRSGVPQTTLPNVAVSTRLVKMYVSSPIIIIVIHHHHHHHRHHPYYHRQLNVCFSMPAQIFLTGRCWFHTPLTTVRVLEQNFMPGVLPDTTPIK